MGCYFDSFLGRFIGAKVAEYLTIALVVVGLFVLLSFFSRFVRNVLLRPLLGGGIIKKYSKDGAWAVVTGCTDGIGKAFAIGLAKKGFNVVLISRSKEKLQATKSEVEAAGTKAEIFALDFSTATSADYKNVANVLKDKKVTVLINNVGLSYDHAAFFHEVDEKRARDIIEVNINAMHDMTRVVLPQMRAQKLGFIVNVSSGTAYLHSPGYVSVYGASKAYVSNWTAGMADEYAREGVRFETLVPWFVSTAMSKSRPSLTIPKPEVYARSALNWFGCAGEHTGYFWHELQHFFATELPASLIRGQAVKFHADIRRRALAKKEREAKKN